MFWHAAVMPPLPMCRPSLSDTTTTRCPTETARSHAVHAGLGEEVGWQRTAGKAARKHAALACDVHVGNARAG